MLPTKIVVIGAGSASFGLNTLGSLLRSQHLRGSHLALVDLNAQALEQMGRLAERSNREWGAGMSISTHTDHRQALSGAKFVVLSIEVPPREVFWRSDFEIPLKYGVRQPYAENGGPGGFAHAARNIGPILRITRDMEQLCPDAWLINFTNPLMRSEGASVAVAGNPKIAALLWPYGIRLGTCSFDSGSPMGLTGVLSTATRLVCLLTRWCASAVATMASRVSSASAPRR